MQKELQEEGPAINEKDTNGSNDRVEETKENLKDLAPSIENIAEKEENEPVDDKCKESKFKPNEQEYTFEVEGYSKEENLW